MNLQEQDDLFIADLNRGDVEQGTLFLRALFLLGEHDQSGETVDEVLAVTDAQERFYLAIGRLGELIGMDIEEDAITFSSPVAVTVENIS